MMATISWRPCLLALAIVGSALPAGATTDAGGGVRGWAGKIDGAWHWRLPNAPGGLKPTQSWHATGSAPDGDIYVGGMDHATNAALYRLDTRANTLRYVGDAQSASEAAGNWLPGETAQKFHTRPLWLNGKVYVATMDRSTLDDAYLGRPGFHWYAYDTVEGGFADLSAREPGGSAIAHGAVVTLAADPARGVIYGAGVPTGDLYRYNVIAAHTENLGRPASYDRPYVYAGRVMWVDSRGRLYFSAGNPLLGSYDPEIYGHVHYYDPAGGFGELPEWRLEEPRALEVGQCLPDGKRCFFADDQGHVYRFADDGPSWSYVGHVETPRARLWVWLFELSADGAKAYVGTSSWEDPANPASLYEFDLATGATRLLCGLDRFAPELSRLNLHTGYDSWDGAGRFYFASFAMGSDENVVVTRIDPVRLKVALGVLPSLTEVSVARTPEGTSAPGFIFARTGDQARPQKVLYKLVLSEAGGTAREQRGSIEIPAGARSATLGLAAIADATPSQALHGQVFVVANGNDYVLGPAPDLSF